LIKFILFDILTSRCKFCFFRYFNQTCHMFKIFLLIAKIFDERFDKIIDDKCDDKVVIYMFSQFKKKTRCWRAFLLWCFDFRLWINLICTTWNNEFRLIDQNWSNSKNTLKRKKRRKKMFVCLLSILQITRIVFYFMT
jgi:hypothetical protein